MYTYWHTHAHTHTQANELHPEIIGVPTDAENKLVFGSYDGKTDPLDLQDVIGDTEKPAEDVLMDAQGNNFVHKPQGEPISDSVIANWDLWNGVADP
jgi:hypothetical protein